MTKTNSNLAVKLAERRHLSFSVNLMNHLFQVSALFIGTKCIELKWLCKHFKKVRSGQASMSINYCTELSKTDFSL